jgi:hypothetical protein
MQASLQANTPLLFLVFFLLIAAAGRGKLVWNSLPAKQKQLRLVVLGIAIAAAVIRTYWVTHHAASF